MTDTLLDNGTVIKTTHGGGPNVAPGINEMEATIGIPCQTGLFQVNASSFVTFRPGTC